MDREIPMDTEMPENSVKTPPVKAYPEHMDSVQTAEYMNTTMRHVGLLRRLGVLPAVRMGKHYVYSRSDCDQFFRDWSSYDMSSEEHVLASIGAKRAKEKRNV